MYKAFNIGMLALALAVFLDLLVYKQTPGLNLPIASLAFIGTTYLAMYMGGHSLPLRAHIAAVFSFLFALPYAIGTSDMMLTLTTLGFLSSHLLFASFAVGHDDRFNHPVEIFWKGTASLLLKIIGRVEFLGKLKPPALSQKSWAVTKGLIVLVPLLAVFTALFASADPVFNSYFNNLGEWLSTWSNAGDITVQLVLISLFFIAIVPFLAAAAIERYAHEARAERAQSWHVESKVILVGLAALFAVFLIVQGSVMFGGSEAFVKIDLTYAEYAHQGFNQLIIASALVALIVLTLRDQHGEKSDGVLTSLHGLLIVETLLVLVSAAMRLSLYIDTYGYTDTRLGAYWTIITIGIMLVLLLANVIQRESQIVLMRRALVVLGVCALVFCYSMPDAMATRMNFRRVDEGKAFDLKSLQALSDESVPIIAEELSGMLGQKPSNEEYCRAFSNVTAFSSPLSPERRQELRSDHQERLEVRTWLTRDSALSEEEAEAFDWRDWNYATVRANDILPIEVPDWLNVPAVGDSQPTCAVLLPPQPPQPTGIVPSERVR